MTVDDRVNILLVDDQPSKLLSYEAILSDLGENLIKANSPELDGFELAESIRQHPRYQKTAIIFVSAVHLTDLDRLKGYESGAVDYVSVPVVPTWQLAQLRSNTSRPRSARARSIFITGAGKRPWTAAG